MITKRASPGIERDNERVGWMWEGVESGFWAPKCASLFLSRLTDLWVRERRDGCGDGVKFKSSHLTGCAGRKGRLADPLFRSPSERFRAALSKITRRLAA